MNEGKASVRIGGLGTATPVAKVTQGEILEQAKKHYAKRIKPRSMAMLEKLLAHPSVQERHLAVQSVDELVDEGRDARVKRFTDWSVKLAAEAIEKALEKTCTKKEDVTALVVNTCTGYICPGVSTYLVEKLGLSPEVRCFDLVGAGCGGAGPSVQMCEALLGTGEKRNGNEAVISAAVEICSATCQMGDDANLLVSNALFGDGAAAAIMWKKEEGLELVRTASRLATEFREDIRYVHKDGDLHNQLSMRLPGKSAGVVGELMRGMLGAEGVEVAKVKHWALHPGGQKVIDAVQKELGLTAEQLAPTCEVLRRFGNMSSATVWFVLEELERRGMGKEKGEWCVMGTFGAGLAAHGMMLRT